MPAKNMFFGNEVDPMTATIPVYVESANTDNLLVPGNYVDIFVGFLDFYSRKNILAKLSVP